MSNEQRPVFMSNILPEWADSDQWVARAQQEAAPMAMTPGAALVALRWGTTGELVCAYCGKTFEGRTSQKGPRYCTPSHRQMAYSRRKRPTDKQVG